MARMPRVARWLADYLDPKFILCDHILNSHNHSVSQSMDITGRNLMLITLRA